MANLLKKMVGRPKSRSKSPVKSVRTEFDRWPQNIRREEPNHWHNSFNPMKMDPWLNSFRETDEQRWTTNGHKGNTLFDNWIHPSLSHNYTQEGFRSSKPVYNLQERNQQDEIYVQDEANIHHAKSLLLPSDDVHRLSPHYSLASNLSDGRISPNTQNDRIVVNPIWSSQKSQTAIVSRNSSKSYHSDAAKEPKIAQENQPNTETSECDASEIRLQNPRRSNNSSSSEIRFPENMEDYYQSHRHRSHSPTKSRKQCPSGSSIKSRSKSPQKKFRGVSNVLDYLSPQCYNEGCSVALIVQDTKFLVCKHQLSHASEYFRLLLMGNNSVPVEGASRDSLNQFMIVVSSFKHPSPSIQFKWFLESAIPAPVIKDITDDTLETCMRLSKRFQAKGVEMMCARYIQDNVSRRLPMIALCWLNWVLKHKFDRATYNSCLPCVATASLTCLEQHRNMITERLLADLLAAKLRTIYQQAVSVFQTIHSMDHFFVDADRCPRCGRQKDQGGIRVQSVPCRKLLGCERCLKDFECEMTSSNRQDYQAYYQCRHGLNALNDSTSDCHCQMPILALNISKVGGLHPTIAVEHPRVAQGKSNNH